MKYEYIKPVIETIALFNQPVLAGHSNPDADSKGGTIFPEDFEEEERNASAGSATQSEWK